MFKQVAQASLLDVGVGVVGVLSARNNLPFVCSSSTHLYNSLFLLASNTLSRLDGRFSLRRTVR